MSTSQNKSLIIWLLSGCFLITAMVIIGGITRLTNSGLSMVEWKLIMGSIPPLNEQEWMVAFEKYQQFPEYQKLHNHFNLSDFKSIFIWEYLHRLLGRLIGLVFIIPFVLFLIRKKISKTLLPRLILIFIWGGFQGFLGWFMVKSGLVDNPHVSHFRLAIHLVTAFGLCCYIFWVVLGLMNKDALKQKSEGFRLGIILFVATGLQIIYGAFVAGLKAGYVHPTWPKMSSYWMDPSIHLAVKNMGFAAIFEDAITIQFVHRWFAFVVVFLVAYMYVKLQSKSLNPHQLKAINILLVAVLLQAVLGITTLLMHVPITLAVLHQLVALLLWMSVVYFLYHFKNKAVAEV